MHANFHDYEIDWQPDSITWSIDGNAVRTLDREDTWNATANRYYYPQTPCQVQLSLWPGGLSTNGEGTIAWAGGLVQWNSPYMTNGYYYAQFDSVSIQCYDPPSGANIQGSKSYIFTDPAMTNNSVEVTNNNTVLSSFLGTGTNLTAGTSTGSSSSNSSAPAQVPGLSGVGTGTNGGRGSNSTSNGGSSSSSGSGSGSGTGSGTASSSGAASSGFVQGDGGEGSKNGAGSVGGNTETVFKGSLFAVVVAVVGLCVL